MIIIVKGKKRLCKDRMWREFAHFGTFKECVKIYQRRGVAEKIATSQNAILTYKGKTPDVKVVEVPDLHTVDAVGNVFDVNDRLIATLETL